MGNTNVTIGTSFIFTVHPHGCGEHDYANGDYSLSGSGSSLYDVGTVLADITDDILGNPRS